MDTFSRQESPRQFADDLGFGFAHGHEIVFEAEWPGCGVRLPRHCLEPLASPGSGGQTVGVVGGGVDRVAERLLPVRRRQVVLALAVQHAQAANGQLDHPLAILRLTGEPLQVKYYEPAGNAALQPVHQFVPRRTLNGRVPCRTPGINQNRAFWQVKICEPQAAYRDLPTRGRLALLLILALDPTDPGVDVVGL